MRHRVDKLMAKHHAHGLVKRGVPGLMTALRVPISPALTRDSWWNRSYGRTLDVPAGAKLVVIGLPKSGNTWLLSLLRDYLDVPALPDVNAVRAVGTRGIGMTHEPLSRRLQRRRDFVHAAYILRDVRDVIVSFFHCAQTDRFRAPRPDFHYADIDSFYYEYFLSTMVPHLRWHSHADEYARVGVPVVRYERLWDEPEHELERLVARLGFEVDRARIADAVELNRIDRLRKSGKDVNLFVPPSHFRKGGYGGYVDELPSHILADVNERFAGFLSRWGYAVPESSPELGSIPPPVHPAEGHG